MKKIISMILVIAMVAALAISASAATIVVHDQTDWETQNQIEHGNYGDGFGSWCGWLNGLPYSMGYDYTVAAVRRSAAQVKVLDITEGTVQTWTKCAEAATIAELKAVCEANEGINNLTVFRQRNVEAEGEIAISVKLWPCAQPTESKKYENQATVVLFRADAESEWEVVGCAKDKVCDATLPGSGMYCVCLAW